ncbi:MAG: bifunctional phosphoribosylaminoimidazolecarboxamide formyltransferase/IMP cyclohydrolase [Ignavibacteria bacterium]|nr:bifunctional phosphoribosylaminoimidazolecarboxamide formyltransferase/IMP cyclohydrolase [Ignavibacteria bacterium]MCU7515348.1 bifunctional phosphoribosylaminoimidazolecarboxamide formyltransferase/IMP cyclohydrolase [Ignavibacteria bacterium]
MKKLALISVSDKSGITEFARDLSSLGYEILATGNTAKLLTQNDIKCTEISDFTDFPEIFSGRVKTLQPRIFGGILMRRDNESDISEAEKNNVVPIDIVCVNLYPFPKVVEEDLPLDVKIENIDIGGPSLIRAASKNYKYVSVLTDPGQYSGFIEELKKGEISLPTRQSLAAAAFSYTSFYDTLIANFLEKAFGLAKTSMRLNFPLSQSLRYGENPHQAAALYGSFNKYFEIVHGKEISYNNIIDLIAAVELVQEIKSTACVIVKHTNPCGAAMGSSVLDAYQRALSSDPVSAYGGIVAFNEEVDKETALKLNEIFLEIVCAPSFSEEAMEILLKKKNRRLVKVLGSLSDESVLYKSVPGGLISQAKDNSRLDKSQTKTVTKKQVNEDLWKDLELAWVVCKHTKSNAIVYAKDRKIIGVGAGQMSRVDSARIAVLKAKEHGHDLENAVAASDAFFPFADGVIEMASNGIQAVIQPGGSVRDDEVIKAADENNLAMVFTGIRNFKH